MVYINKTKNTKKKIILIASVAIIALGGVTYALYSRGQSHPESDDQTTGINYANPSEEQKKSGQDIKEGNIHKDESKPSEAYNSESAPSQTDRQATAVGVIISRADIVNDNLQVGTVIQEIASSGTCTLTLKKEGQEPFIETAGAQAISDYTTCKGFTIPVGNLSEGTWQLSVEYARDSVKGVASAEVHL